MDGRRYTGIQFIGARGVQTLKTVHLQEVDETKRERRGDGNGNRDEEGGHPSENNFPFGSDSMLHGAFTHPRNNK